MRSVRVSTHPSDHLGGGKTVIKGVCRFVLPLFTNIYASVENDSGVQELKRPQYILSLSLYPLFDSVLSTFLPCFPVSLFLCSLARALDTCLHSPPSVLTQKTRHGQESHHLTHILLSQQTSLNAALEMSKVLICVLFFSFTYTDRAEVLSNYH